MTKKSTLRLETLAVESFVTSAGPLAPRAATVRPGGGCVCDVAPCICSAGPDCTTGSAF